MAMRRWIPAALALAVTACLIAQGRTAAQLPQAPPPAPAPQPLGMPTPLGGDNPAADMIPIVPANPLPPGAVPVPVSLPVALRLGRVNNLDIAQAREGVNAARAVLERARAGILPNLNVGSTYSEHEGNIAKTEGNIIKANKDALFVVGGPSMSVALVEAIYGPRTARQLERASEAGLRRVTQDTLLAVADAYFNVLRARRRLARTEETLDYLTADRLTPRGTRFLGVLPLVRAHVQAGGREASLADLERVRVEILRREEERAGAVTDYRVAAAELARLLRLDPAAALWPVEDFRYPLPLPGDGWYDRPLEDLVAFALANRPELAENQALVQAALERVRTAQARPLVPNLVLNYNWGDFGGAPDPNPAIITPSRTPGGRPTVTNQAGFGPSGRILHFGTRSDFDVSLVWRLQNLGLGNRAEIREQAARHRQATLRELQEQDRVVTQVVQVVELVAGWRERVRVTQAALFDEQGAPNGPVFRALRLDFDRIRGAEGRPLEMLDSVRRLSDLLEAYGQAATEYERARFRLLIALGLPADTLFDPGASPGPDPAGACEPPPGR
jgi:outer membrane protein TolC